MLSINGKSLFKMLKVKFLGLSILYFYPSTRQLKSLVPDCVIHGLSI